LAEGPVAPTDLPPEDRIGWDSPCEGLEDIDRLPGRLFRVGITAQVGLQVTEVGEVGRPALTNADQLGILAGEGAERIGRAALDLQGLDGTASGLLKLTEIAFQRGQVESHLHIAGVFAHAGLAEGDPLLTQVSRLVEALHLDRLGREDSDIESCARG